MVAKQTLGLGQFMTPYVNVKLMDYELLPIIMRQTSFPLTLLLWLFPYHILKISHTVLILKYNIQYWQSLVYIPYTLMHI